MISRSVMFDSLWPCGLQPTRLLCPWEFSSQEYWRGLPCPSPGYLPNPGIESRSPTLQADSLPSEPPGKPKNTGVGSLFLLQWIFLTQESKRGLLHCRQILYRLSYQGRIVSHLATRKGEVCFCLCSVFSALPVIRITVWLNSYWIKKVFSPLLPLRKGFMGWEKIF